MSAHLGDQVTALADGQLGPAEHDRALAHVAACAVCARALEVARETRRTLASACDVQPDPELTRRLLALSASIPTAADDPLRAPERDVAWQVPESWRCTLTGDVVDARRRRRTRRLVLTGVGSVAVLGGMLFVLGNGPVVAPDPSRVAALTTLASAAPAGDDAAARGQWLAALAEDGWAAPDALPAGYEVTALHVDADTISLEVSGPEGRMVVHERTGRLEELTGTAAEPILPGRDVVVLTRSPWHVAWQAGDVVVEVTADVPKDVLVEVVEAFPGHDYDDGVVPRIARGWMTVTGVLDR